MSKRNPENTSINQFIWYSIYGRNTSENDHTKNTENNTENTYKKRNTQRNMCNQLYREYQLCLVFDYPKNSDRCDQLRLQHKDCENNLHYF